VDFEKLLALRNQRREALNARLAALGAEGQAILDGAEGDNRRALTDTEDARASEIIEERTALREQIAAVDAEIAGIRAEQAADQRATELAQESRTVATAAGGSARVISEPRTYAEENDKRGVQFALDVARSYAFGDIQARERLARHMQEERVERGDLIERAAGTSAFSGLVVPQYLVDSFAPMARAGRPFADACRHHDLPPKGMSVNIGRVTTGTTVADQSAENAAVSDQDMDDTLLTIPVATAGGSQTLSRQAVERGEGVEDVTVEDLIRAYASNLDAQLLNKASTGLTNVATAITYTSASPTATELYPKLIGGAAAVEAALLDQGVVDTIAFMHSRRWYWLQTQLSSTWPLFGQPGVAAQLAGANYGERYGAGFRGVLPNGTPVVVDNNIATNLGAGTNQDEIYFGAQSELHLWEDPNAPLLIRAEQPKAKNLGIDLVVYGYYAFTFARRVHAQKIAGTGLVAPTF
jgi:HK97 family phage major capsid protein